MPTPISAESVLKATFRAGYPPFWRADFIQLITVYGPLSLITPNIGINYENGDPVI